MGTEGPYREPDPFIYDPADRDSYFRKRGPYPVPPPTARESVVPEAPPPAPSVAEDATGRARA